MEQAGLFCYLGLGLGLGLVIGFSGSFAAAMFVVPDSFTVVVWVGWGGICSMKEELERWKNTGKYLGRIMKLKQ